MPVRVDWAISGNASSFAGDSLSHHSVVNCFIFAPPSFVKCCLGNDNFSESVTICRFN